MRLLKCERCRGLRFKYDSLLMGTQVLHLGKSEFVQDWEFVRNPFDVILKYYQDWIDATHYFGDRVENAELSR